MRKHPKIISDTARLISILNDCNITVARCIRVGEGIHTLHSVWSQLRQCKGAISLLKEHEAALHNEGVNFNDIFMCGVSIVCIVH